MLTITISRNERDVILGELMWIPETLPAFDTREKGIASLAALQCAFDLYDELGGWDADGDTRDTFAASVTSRLISLLRAATENAVQAITYEQEGLESSRSGDRDRWLGATLEDSVAAREREIAIHANTRDRCQAVLSRLDAETVTA
jgi:hypothetical protein